MTKNDPRENDKISRQFENITSIYMDTKNKINWKTVGTGTWYNQPLWLYLLTYKNKPPATTGEWKEPQ